MRTLKHLQKPFLCKNSTAWQVFELITQSIIILSLIVIVLETLPSASHYGQWFVVFEWVTVAIFTIEYGVRLFVSRPWTSYVFSFYGLVDLLAILPFYISISSLDLRALRVLRLIRIIRVLKLGRSSRALERLRLAFKEIKDELIAFGICISFLLYLASLGIYHFEHVEQPETFSHFFAALWWAICTITTVGYGDVVPVTVGGKILGSVVIILGIGIIAVPTGLLAAAFEKTGNVKRIEDG